MKSFRRVFLGYFVALAAAAFLAQDASAVANKAVVRAVRGTVDVSSNGGKSWQKARVGLYMAANSMVRTASESSVDLFLGENGPVVRVTPSTQLGIDKLDLENTGIEKVIDTQLDLKNGKILGSVKKMAAASKYEVKTPVGIAGIRGTEYSIDSRGNLNVVTGTVVIVYIIDGVTIPAITVNDGQSASPPATGTGTPTVTALSATSDDRNQVTTLTVNITTRPDGTMVDNNTGATTGPNGTTGGGTTGQTTGQATGTTTVGPGPTTTTTTGNFDVTNGGLSPNQPDATTSGSTTTGSNGEVIPPLGNENPGQ